MDRRERLRRCFFHEELDRPAVYCRMYISDTDRSYDELRSYLDAHAEVKRPLHATRFASGPPTEQRREPRSEEWDRVVTTVRTPAGPLEESYLESRVGRPGLHDTYLLKTREDAERYLSLPMPVFAGNAGGEYRRLDAEVGDKGLVEVVLGGNPGGTTASLFGSEAFALMTVTDRDLVHALCERRMQVLLRLVDWLMDQGVGPCFDLDGQEYIVPPLHGPQDFREFNVKYDTPVVARIHERGGRIHVHCHGPIKKVFQGFLDTGVDVLHPFEPPPMGDITAKEAKDLARGKMCLEGNIQIASMYEHSPEQIREETEALIADAFDDGTGLIVCPSASPYINGKGAVCFEQYKAMVETVRRYAAR